MDRAALAARVRRPAPVPGKVVLLPGAPALHRLHLGRAVWPYQGGNMIEVYPIFQKAYSVWQTCALALSPVFYLGIFLGFMWVARRVTRSASSVLELGLQFGYSLIPIAFVYNITHYYTLIAT